VEADDLDIETLGPAPARTQPIAPAALAIAMATGILIALELLRPVHAIDASARAALETAIAVAALLSSRLLLEIFGRTRQLRELLLVLGVLLLWLADFSYWAGPVVAGVRGPASGGAVRVGCELGGALALAAAALVPPTSIVKPLPALAKVAAVIGIGVIAIGTFVAQIIVAHAATGPAKAATAGAAAHSVTIGVQIASAVILAVAGLAFVAKSWRAERGTELLAGASLLLGAAGVQFMAVPTVPADWVTPREGARLVAFALLLGGVCLRYVKVRRRHAHEAICSERERIARDLHDGLAQDLVCITMQAQRLDCHLDPDHPVMLATRDALAELRGMIADLTASTAPSSEAAVRMIARELGRRLNAEVRVRPDADAASAVDGGMDFGPHDDLIRAAREAIVHSGVRGDARHADIALPRQADGGLVVHASDDDARGIPEPQPVAAPVGKLPVRGVSRLSTERSLRARRRRPA
jgi:signal transduction histidine kinase